MFLERRTFLITACLVTAVLSRVGGKNVRKPRSINDLSYQRRGTARSNALLHSEDVNHRLVGWNYLTPPNYDVSTISDENSREFQEEERKLFKVITSKDYRVSTPSEIEKFDRIGEQMIARANLTEEAKRVVRQVKQQRPGFFWTLARVAFETVNDTKSAVQQINFLIADNFAPDTTTIKTASSPSLTNKSTTTQRAMTSNETNTTESMETTTTTTTEEPFKLTRSELQSLIRRNVRGLVRLFNIEWRDALNQSQTSVREFQRDLSNRISPFLQDDPNVV